MEFTVVTRADLTDKGGIIAGGVRKQREPDNWVGRLTKEIPADVIAVYLTAAGIVKSINDLGEQKILYWVVFVLLLVMTPLYQWRIKKVVKWQQIALSTGAFLVWVFSLGGPFAQFTWYSPGLGALVLPLYTLFLAVAQPQA